jgi:Ni/Co efflux regulator RcnB
MKRILLATAAIIAIAGPFAISSASAQSSSFEGPTRHAQYQDERGNDREDARDRRDRRDSWRDERREARWDDARHNGYYENGRWTYGPPSADQYGRPGFSLGYQPWERGQRLGYYDGRFDEVNYRRANLPPPRRGYHWVRADRGDAYLLVSIRSGRILQVIVRDDNRRDRRQAWREDRRDARWDDARHNGYYRDGQWTYGPPADRNRRGDAVYGYQPWERGQRLGYYNGRYTAVDYRSDDHMSAPPRGHRWVRNDSGDYLLAAIATGVIVQVILNSDR